MNISVMYTFPDVVFLSGIFPVTLHSPIHLRASKLERLVRLGQTFTKTHTKRSYAAWLYAWPSADL